jgi:hypothetical protein
VSSFASFSAPSFTVLFTTCLSLLQSDSISDVKGPESFWFLGGWCLNLLSTASLFLSQTPVASNALKISRGVNIEIQAD